MPSSTCWPPGEKAHFWVDGTASPLNTSARPSRANSPRRFTQGESPVETVTSGDSVTIRSAIPPVPRAISPRIFPNAPCVDCSASSSQTGPAVG